MREHCAVLLCLAAAVSCLGQENAVPKNELAFGLGGIPALSRVDQPNLSAGPGVAFAVNYARKFLSRRTFALYGEVMFLASPQRQITSSIPTATRDVASLYITPGVRLKLLPAARISPYFAVGGGYGDYEQSKTQLDGRRNPAPRELSRGVVDFGSGVDVRLWRWLALRGEARDFYTGSPAYNVTGISGGQHNLVAGGAFVLRWH